MTHANSESLTHPEETIAQSVIRYHYMDNVRALAMFVGVLFHASLAYSPLFHNLWFTTGNESSAAIDMVAVFTHLFRMPVFFLISGFFAIMMIQKRGLFGYIKNRSLRILLPFIIFFPILAFSIMVSIGWAMEHVDHLSPMLQFIKMMANNPDAAPPPLSTMHLWFLFNLFLFVLMAAILYRFKFFHSQFVSKIASVKFIIFILPLFMVPSMFTQTAPHPAPEKFYPELWSFGFYGVFFLLGGVIFLKQRLLDELAVYKNILLVLSLISYGVFYLTLPKTFSAEDIMKASADGFDPDWVHLHVAILEAYIAVYMTLYCLLIGKQLLNRQNKILKLISDSSYWVYLIHLPILLLIQFALADVDMNMWLKFLMSTFTTFFIGLVSYVLFVKWTPIGWLLNGRKKEINKNSVPLVEERT